MTFKEHKMPKTGGRHRMDSSYVLAAVRHLNRIELFGQTLFHVLDFLAQIAPDWLRILVNSDWFVRYCQRLSNSHLPKKEEEQIVIAEIMGKDGFQLLRQIYSEDSPAFLRMVQAVQTLRKVWLQNYYHENEILYWRTESNLPPAYFKIISPYDEEAHFGVKREMNWYGYKVHLTETCQQDVPNLITHVETTPSNEQDNLALEKIHTTLQEIQLLPEQHVVDAWYVSGENLVSSEQNYHIDLLGVICSDNSWQARDENEFDQAHLLERLGKPEHYLS